MKLLRERMKVELQLREFARMLPRILGLFNPNDDDVSLPDWVAGLQALKQSLKSWWDPEGATLPPRLAQLLRRYDGPADYERQGNRIHWYVTFYAPLRWEQEALRIVPAELRLAAQGTIEASMTATRQWFLEAPLNTSEYWQALCTDLPAVADVDPQFALSLLRDPERNRRPAERPPKRRIDPHDEVRFLRSVAFRHIRHNALVHVLSALANNHFRQIEPVLDWDLAPGRYAPLIPRYIGTILAAKTETIRRLIREDYEAS